MSVGATAFRRSTAFLKDKEVPTPRHRLRRALTSSVRYLFSRRKRSLSYWICSYANTWSIAYAIWVATCRRSLQSSGSRCPDLSGGLCAWLVRHGLLVV